MGQGGQGDAASGFSGGLASESSEDEEEGGRSHLAPKMKTSLLRRAARAKRAIAYEWVKTLYKFSLMLFNLDLFTQNISYSYIYYYLLLKSCTV